MNKRNTLVVIPITKPLYSLGFSAPLAWLFSDNIDQVKGVYSFQLNKELILQYEYFIIELNWITELYEVLFIIKNIKTINKESKIMIGGLFSSIHHKKLVHDYNIDYFIKGFNELPIKMFLDGHDIRDIPNFYCKDFENDISYILSQEDWSNIKFDIGWNSLYNDKKSFYKYMQKVEDDIDFYSLPMITTSRSGCSCIHDGCNYCMGSKIDFFKDSYKSNRIILENSTLIKLLKNVENKYNNVSIYFMSDIELYDLKNINFNLNANIEIDCSIINIEKLKEILYAFKKCTAVIPISKDGIMSHNIIQKDLLKKIASIQDKNHRIRFLSYSDLNFDPYSKDLIDNGINIQQVLDVFNIDFAVYDNYKDFDFSYDYSKRFFNGYIMTDTYKKLTSIIRKIF